MVSSILSHLYESDATDRTKLAQVQQLRFYLFVDGLFNDALISTVYVASNCRMSNDELERVLKVAVIIYRR